MVTILLLTASNIFMTFAWYGHLKFSDVPLWKVIVISRGIAFAEYCLMVPANRIGRRQFSVAQLNNDHSGDRYCCCIQLLFCVLRERRTPLELHSRFCLDYCRRLFHLQKVVELFQERTSFFKDVLSDPISSLLPISFRH